MGDKPMGYDAGYDPCPVCGGVHEGNEPHIKGSLFGKRIGARVLICPECTTAIWDAGPGRAFCSGQQQWGPHPEIELVPYRREDGDG